MHPKSQMSQKVLSIHYFSLLSFLLPNSQKYGFGQHIAFESVLPMVTNAYESPEPIPPFHMHLTWFPHSLDLPFWAHCACYIGGSPS